MTAYSCGAGFHHACCSIWLTLGWKACLRVAECCARPKYAVVKIKPDVIEFGAFVMGAGPLYEVDSPCGCHSPAGTIY